jgi:hypothetical protein
MNNNMPPAPQRKELTGFQKGEFIALSHHENNSQIVSELHIPRQTVSSFVKRYHCIH